MDFDGISLESLLDNDAENKLVLPNFQRDFVWSKNEQRDLLGSFVADIPIGSILVLEGQKGDFASRPLAFNKDIQPAFQCKYLLDGQQRIACLKTVFSDSYANTDDWISIWEDLFNLLRLRWFIRVVPEESTDLDLFGWNRLHFGEFPRDVTPQDVSPLIEYRRVNKTQPKEWHHPYYQHFDAPELTEDQKRLRVGRASAKDGLVPLWEIYGHDSEESDPVHFHALREVASARAADLRAATRDDQDAWIDLLKPIDPSIEEHLGDPGRIDEAWSTLRVRWIERVATRLSELVEHKIPMAQVPPNQPERAIAIFENINLGGTALTVFDLIVAKAALGAEKERSLRRKIVDQLQELLEVPAAVRAGLQNPPQQWSSGSIGIHDDEAPSKITKNQYLNLLSIFGHLDYPNTEGLRVDHIKKTKQLALTADDINDNTQDVVAALKRAFLFLHLRCGIVSTGDLSYDLMLLPIAFCLNNREFWKDSNALAKIEYWFWVSLFGGTYRERQNPRCIEDIRDLNSWLRGEVDNPFANREERLFDVEDYSDKDTLLLEKVDEAPPPAAIRQGIMQFLLSQCPQDLLPDERFEPVYLTPWGTAEGHKFKDREGTKYEMILETHHVIPLASASKLGESSRTIRKDGAHILNSPLNLTPISKVANQMISGRAPRDYVGFIDDLGVADHCLPHNFGERFEPLFDMKESERAKVYRDLLSDRYDLIRIRLRERLRDLESKV